LNTFYAISTYSPKEFLMRRLLICLLLLCLPLIAVHAQPSPDDAARAFLDLLLEDNYDAAFALFNAELQAVVPQTRLLEVWSSIQFYGGTFQRTRGVEVNGDSATLTADFERAAYNILVSVDADGLIYRLFFSPTALEPITDESAEESTLPRLSRGYAPVDVLPSPTVTAPTGAVAQAVPEVEVPESRGRAGDPSDLPPADVVPGLEFAAASVIESLARDDFEVVTEQFTSQLQTVLSPARLEQVWDAVAAQAGDYRMIVVVRADEAARTAVVTLQFENAMIDALVSFDENGQVYSLYFVPSTGEGTSFQSFEGEG
jgi:hypothetical protein